MESLGLKQVKGSGNVWNSSKEDGENDYILCQLKSTDAQSIRVQQLDIHKLVEHATLSKRLPVFAIQFLNNNEVWLMARPEDFTQVAQYIDTGECERPETDMLQEMEIEVKKRKPKKVVTSSQDAREAFNEEQKKKYDKTKSAI